MDKTNPHAERCEQAVATVSLKYPDIEDYQTRIVELSESSLPNDNEQPEDYLIRLYHLAKADEKNLIKDAEVDWHETKKQFEKMKKEYEEKYAASMEALASVKALPLPTGPEAWTTAAVPSWTTMASPMPIAGPDYKPPPPPPPKKKIEMPKVEKQKARMIRLKKTPCRICNEAALKGGEYCKGHQEAINSWDK